MTEETPCPQNSLVGKHIWFLESTTQAANHDADGKETGIYLSKSYVCRLCGATRQTGTFHPKEQTDGKEAS